MKPILFNTDMVRAILDGRKTVTRRVVNQKAAADVLSSPARLENPDIPDHRFIEIFCTAPGEPGDILYVRETWAKDVGRYMYKASYSKNEKFYRNGKEVQIKWRPSIHMPKEVARLFLRVKSVRVERLLDPFFADGAAVLELKKEGMVLPEECVECIGNYGKPSCVDTGDDSECGMLDEIRGDFSKLWDTTLKPADLPIYGWAANPWVWVIEFERCEKPKEG